MNTIRLLFDAPVDGDVVAVQETFGKAYRRINSPVEVNEIVSTEITQLRYDAHNYIGAFRVLAPAHVNTIRAILRRYGRGYERLAQGRWYEVHSD